METKYTKGTWFAKDGQIYPEETGETLALIPYFDEDNQEQKANMKLIELAPAMYEANQKLVERLKLWHETYELWKESDHPYEIEFPSIEIDNEIISGVNF